MNRILLIISEFKAWCSQLLWAFMLLHHMAEGRRARDHSPLTAGINPFGSLEPS
jgi:hypothetical protein